MPCVILSTILNTFFFQFFTHPVVHSEMTRKWRGRFLMKKDLGKWTWFFLHIWCLFDMVLAPITFYIVSYLEMYSLFAGKYFTNFKLTFTLYLCTPKGGSESPTDNLLELFQFGFFNLQKVVSEHVD